MAASRKNRRRALRNIVVPPLIIVGLLGALFLGVDQHCLNDANRRLPFYPDASKVSEDFNGLRARGIGNSLVVLETSDSVEVVESWYEMLSIELLNEGRTRGVNNLNRWLEEPENSGTQIFYLSQCVL